MTDGARRREGPGRTGRIAGLAASVRLRAAAVAMVIVGAAFGLGSYGLLTLLQRSLTGSVTSTATAEALDIASFIQLRGRLPHRLPISIEEMAAQVVGPGGAVLAASANVEDEPPISSLRPPPGSRRSTSGIILHLRRRHHLRAPVPYDTRFAVAAVGVRHGSETLTVLVAGSLGAEDHAVDATGLALGIVLPAVLLLVGALVAVLAGWALRPVEAIRAEVDALAASELHRRVPEPPSNDEIGRLAQTMNAMLSRLEAAAERQRQLVADVSHELRNPLASLRTQLEVAATHPGTDSPALLQGAVEEIGRLTTLVADLLTLARLDEGTLPARRAEVDVDEIVLAQADRLRRRGRVEVSVRGVGAGRMLGDEGQLGRLMANLADNAERHARRRVAFAVRVEAGTVVVEVTDDGSGIPEPWRERVFERFVRLDAARTFGESGAGLGLAIVREIARSHGGEVSVEDAAPGARFVVRLPAAQGRVAVPSPPGRAAGATSPASSWARPAVRSSSSRRPSGPSAPCSEGT